MISFITRLSFGLILLSPVFWGCGEHQESDQITDELIPTAFPAGFVPPNDYVTGNPLTGWGGGKGDIVHIPIVFIHGNAHSAENWVTMATYFAAAGYTWNELWAVSYLQVVNNENYNSNEGNWREIDDFVQAVLEYTGEDRVNILSHSLGVTIARTWLKYSNDYDQVETFIGIAGANHGVAFCGPDDHRGMCAELGYPQSNFLNWLNGGDETPFDTEIRWVTLYNGGNLDIFFPEMALMNDSTIHDLRLSPLLEGAQNIKFPEYDHFRLSLAETVFDTLESLLY